MEKCIQSVLAGGEDVEVIIVDDGSTKDETAKIADEYAAKYPTIVKAVHQENGGHGQAVNTGLAHATGKYFKVVDSDDWVDLKSYRRVLATLKKFDEAEEPDMVIANYVYEKVGAKRKKVIHYDNVFPEETLFTWNDIGHFKMDQYILMHTVIYKTELLKKCGLQLPKHTFYVDNIFVFEPLPYVKKMYYINTNFYRYFIGRDDQSVNETVMISRIDQQIRVNEIMIDLYAKHESTFSCPQLKEYMLHYLETIQMVTSVLLMKMNTPESEKMRDDLWHYLEEKSPEGYKALKSSVLGKISKSHNKLSHKLTMGGYKIAQKWIGFN